MLGPWSCSGMRPPFREVVPSAPGFMQLGIDAARDLGGYAGNPLELLGRRGHHRLDRTEVVEQRTTPRRSDALELVEQRCEAPRLAPLPVEADRKPVGLVADPLQELQTRIVT